MSVQIVENINLFEIPADAYAHGCNMKGKMGYGIAQQFKSRYWDMYKAYAEHCDAFKPPLIPGGMFFWPAQNDMPAVYNLFTQVFTGKDARLEACYHAFAAMFNHATQNGIELIAMPAIGAGTGGLRWRDVKFNLVQADKNSDFKGTVCVAFLNKEM